MDKIVKDEIHTVSQNDETVLNYYYTPIYNNPDYNPRHLTLLFDGSRLMAAIGLLEEEDNDYGQSAEWVGCESDVLTETHMNTVLDFETNTMLH